MNEKIEKNKSLAYIIPMFYEHVDISKTGLINSYLLYGSNDELGKIYLYYLYGDHFKRIEEVLNKSDLLYNIYDPDTEHVVVALTIPSKYNKDYYKIIDGRYSEVSDLLKTNIKRYWNLNGNSKVYKVLYKSSELRKEMELDLDVKISPQYELSSKPNKEKETFKL